MKNMSKESSHKCGRNKGTFVKTFFLDPFLVFTILGVTRMWGFPFLKVAFFADAETEVGVVADATAANKETLRRSIKGRKPYAYHWHRSTPQ